MHLLSLRFPTTVGFIHSQPRTPANTFRKEQLRPDLERLPAIATVPPGPNSAMSWSAFKLEENATWKLFPAPPREERLLLHRNTVQVRRNTIITFRYLGAREQPKTPRTHYVHTEDRWVRHHKPRAVFFFFVRHTILHSALHASLDDLSLCRHFSP